MSKRRNTHPAIRPFVEQTLDELEGVTWGEPTFDSYLVSTMHRLRRVPIGQFTIEDLRIAIGQEVGIKFLMPLALDRLEIDPFAEGDFYEGDLLAAVLSVDDAFWTTRRHLVPRVLRIIDAAITNLPDADTSDELPGLLRDARERLGGIR